MSRCREFVALALMALSSVALGCSADGDRPGLILFPGMHESVAYDAYDSHPVIGQSLRLPPGGTVPHDAATPAFGPGEEEAGRAARELRNPLVATEPDIARGKRLFETFCLVCHGSGGQGDGPIIGRFPNPASLTAEHAKQMPDGQVWHVITHGQGLMAAYGKQVLPPDRWRLIAYLRSLQGIDGHVLPPVGMPAPAGSSPPKDSTTDVPPTGAGAGEGS